MKRRVYRRLTRLRTMYNVLKYRKIVKSRRNFNLPKPERNRKGTGNKFNLKMRSTVYTVLRIIKLNEFPVPVRLHSGSGKLKFRRLSPYFGIFKNVYIVWSLVRRQVTMRNVLKYRKYFKTVRCGCGSVAVIFSIYKKEQTTNSPTTC